MIDNTKCYEEYENCIYNENGICTNKDRIVNKYGCQSDITEEDLYERQLEWNSECNNADE